jgi:drug/metabolite transporter (DMT)-like permease
MVAVMAHFAFHDEKLTLRRIGGVLTGFCGMALLIGPAAFQGLSGEGLGFLAMLGVALCYALGNIYARFVREMPPARMALGQQIVSAFVATFIALVWMGTAAYQPALDRMVTLLALGLFATAIPITVFMGLIRMAGPTKASMVGYLMPLWATFFALTFLGETINLRQMAGAAIILLGVFIVTTAPRRVV